MKAETVFNVYQALSEKEKKRFCRMLGMVPAKPKKPKRKPIMTDAEAIEIVLRKIYKKQ